MLTKETVTKVWRCFIWRRSKLVNPLEYANQQGTFKANPIEESSEWDTSKSFGECLRVLVCQHAPNLTQHNILITLKPMAYCNFIFS